MGNAADILYTAAILKDRQHRRELEQAERDWLQKTRGRQELEWKIADEERKRLEAMRPELEAFERWKRQNAMAEAAAKSLRDAIDAQGAYIRPFVDIPNVGGAVVEPEKIMAGIGALSGMPPQPIARGILPPSLGANLRNEMEEERRTNRYLDRVMDRKLIEGQIGLMNKQAEISAGVRADPTKPKPRAAAAPKPPQEVVDIVLKNASQADKAFMLSGTPEGMAELDRRVRNYIEAKNRNNIKQQNGLSRTANAISQEMNQWLQR